MDTPLEGKVALITGSARGMGRSHALLMAERGADIIVHDIRAEQAEETAEDVRKLGRKARVVIADVRDVPSFTEGIRGRARARQDRHPRQQRRRRRHAPAHRGNRRDDLR